MAKQNGLVRIKGTLGDISYYRTKEGFLARESNPISGDRIASDPAFQRTRENGAEFGKAGKAGKVLRAAFRPMLLVASDSRMVARLTTQMLKAIQADTINPRGERTITDGDVTLLKGFEFNQYGPLNTTLYAPFTTTVNRSGGQLSVSIPSFLPINMVAAPEGATHFRILVAGAAVDFFSGSFETDDASTAELPIDGTPTPAQQLVCTVTAGSPNPLFLAVGIAFYQEVNGTRYSLKNGAFNALQLVAVDPV